MILFEESIKSKHTKKNYTSNLTQFRKFTGLFNEKKLLEIFINDLQIMLENYVLYLRQTANPNSIPSKLGGIKHFFVMNRVHLNWEIIYKMLPQRQKTPSLRAYTTKEVKVMLAHSKILRYKECGMQDSINPDNNILYISYLLYLYLG